MCLCMLMYVYVCMYVCMFVCVYVFLCYVCRAVVSIHMHLRDTSVYKHELSLKRTEMNLLLLSEKSGSRAVLQPF
jgi:hypothetical protein